MLRNQESPLESVLAALEMSIGTARFDLKEWGPVYDDLLEVLQEQFGAVTLDIMWERNNGSEARLEPLCMREYNERLQIDERHGFQGRNIVKTKSVVGFCCTRNTAVWIYDEGGLSSTKEFVNRFVVFEAESEPTVPAGTFYAYNRSNIRTEVCYPLRVGERAAGVLNLEFLDVVRPNRRAVSLLRRCARLVAAIHARILADQTLSLRELRALQDAKTAAKAHGVGVVPTAFVAYPMTDPSSMSIGRAVISYLQGLDIRVLEPARRTNDRIVEQMEADMERCHFGVVVTTSFNPNVVFEWGFLRAAGKPIIRLHTKMSGTEQDPFDVAGTNRIDIPYASSGQLDANGLRKSLADAIDLFRDGKHPLHDLFMTPASAAPQPE